MSHPPGAETVIERFAKICASDERIVAAFVGGSIARGEADRFSDIDLCIVARDEAADEVFADRAAIVERLGTPLFLEDWSGEHPEVFVILADGTDLELILIRARQIHELQVGPIRLVLDRTGILTDLDVLISRPADDDQRAKLRELLAWFWHDVSHFIKAVGRGQLWWAAGEVEALRSYCVNVVRIQQGLEAGDEPYFKIDAEMQTTTLDAIRSTFVPMEADALVSAASQLVSFFEVNGRRTADAFGLEYPIELNRVMRARLDAIGSS